MDTTARLQQDVRAATKQQSALSSVVKEQEEKMDVRLGCMLPCSNVRTSTDHIFVCAIRIDCAKHREEDS